MPGKFLVFEGIDGCGKTTHAAALCGHLRGKGYEVLPCREPGGTPLGEDIRKILLGHRSDQMSIESEMMLYMAARAQLLQEVVRPALADDKVVVLDRYFYSTAAYQGEAGGIGAAKVLQICAHLKFEIPDHVFLLDLDPAEGLKRAGTAKDRIESRGEEYFRKVRKGFLGLARHSPKLFTVVDASRPVNEVWEEIRGRAETLI